MKIRINQEILADVYGTLIWGKVIGFGIEGGKKVVDLDCGRWVYVSQIIG